MSTNIELIAFDLGNVLCKVDETTPAKKLAEISGLSLKAAHEIAFGKQHKLLFEGGRTSFADHAKRAIATLGITMSVGEFTDLYDTALIPAEEMFPLVSRIAKAHRIALVSNTSEPHWEYAKRFLPFSTQLDPVIVSYAVSAMKPDQEFYESLLAQSGVQADRILFVDDLKVNIEAARANGMHGHVFTSMAAFEAALVGLDII